MVLGALGVWKIPVRIRMNLIATFYNIEVLKKVPCSLIRYGTENIARNLCSVYVSSTNPLRTAYFLFTLNLSGIIYPHC